MGTALDTINKLAGNEVSDWKAEAVERQNNRDWTQLSFKIAVRILREIRAQKPINGMSQKKLADEMGVSPQYINKLVKGKENLSLETIAKIESVLGITLLEIPTEQSSHPFSDEPATRHSDLASSSTIELCEHVWAYDTNVYLEATGTNG